MIHDIDQLFETDPFDFSLANVEAFFRSFRAAAEFHYINNKFFAALWQRSGITPRDVVDERSLLKTPYMMVNLFKEHEMVSGDRNQIILNLTSSGTSGQKSQIFLDQGSLERVKRSAWQIHHSLGMTSDVEVNYLCFTYDPKVANHLGTAFTDELLTSFTKKKNVYYAIQWNTEKKEFELNVEGVRSCLERYSKQDVPVRILGFPAHLYKILKDHNVQMDLPQDSWVQTGGGWKGFANDEVPKQQFREFIAERLGIPPSRNRDMFGMVEHGIPYCDCEKGNLHIPNYSRVFIRSPRTLEVLEQGEVGLIQFFCSYVTSYPSINLMTTDYGRIVVCDCRLGGLSLEIIGRAGVSKHKGCALTASKLLSNA